MKGVAQVRRPAASRVDPARHARGHSGMPYERQADAAAQRFLRGEIELRRGLTPARAAGVVVPGSAGEPLPTLLRAELEHAFDADLRAVRIHRDAPSAVAALQFGARAFASGATIHFGAGQFAPQSESGRALVAHEIAHVLQQTAVTASGRGARATSQHSTGTIQAADIPEFDKLRPAHAPPPSRKKERAQFDDIADGIAALIAKASDPAGAVESYATTAIPLIATQKWPSQAESLLYDTLKHYGKFEMAVRMLERDNFTGGRRIATIAFSGGLVGELHAGSQGWAVHVKALRNVEWLQAMEAEWLKSFDLFLFRIGDWRSASLKVPEMAGAPLAGLTVNKAVLKLYEQLRESTTVSHNEWVYYVLLLLNDLESARSKRFEEMAKRAQNTQSFVGSPRLNQEQFRADELAKWGKDFKATFKDLPNLSGLADAGEIRKALSPYLAELGKKVAAKAQAALDLWKDVEFLGAIAGISAAKAAPDEKSQAQRLEARAELAGRLGRKAGVPATVAAFLTDVNKSGPGGSRSLDAAGYRDRVGPWNGKLSELLDEKIEPPMVEAFRAGRTDELLAWIALAGWYDGFRSYVAWTSEKTVTMGEGNKRAPLSNQDEIIFHRYRLAEVIARVARPLGWTTASDAAEAIMTGRLERSSILAIRSFDDGEVFKQTPLDPGGLVAQARKDYGEQPLRGYEPFTLDAIAEFYVAAYYGDLTTEIRARLPVNTTAEDAVVNSNAATPYLVQEAKKALKPKLPLRWTVHDAIYVANPRDTREFVDVVAAHPAYLALAAAKQPAGYRNVFALVPPHVLFWWLPSFEPLVAELRGIALFRTLVAATFASERNESKRLELQSKLDQKAWFALLQKTLNTKLKSADFVRKEWPAMLAAEWGAAEGMFKGRRKSFQTAFMQAMRRDRRLIANQMNGDLEAFLDDRRKRGRIDRTLQNLRQFTSSNLALEEREGMLELAALLLETAPNLRKALWYERSYDLVFFFIGFFEAGLKASGTVSALSAGDRDLLLPPRENRDAWIAERIEPLRDITRRFQEFREEVQGLQGFRASKEDQMITPFVKLSSPLPVYTLVVPRYDGIFGPASSTGYRITEVLRSFVYHPPYGSPPSAKRQAAAVEYGYSPPKFNEVDDKTPLAADNVEPLLKIQILQRRGKKVDNSPNWVVVKNVTVTRKDLELIEAVNNGLVWEGFASAMGNIQAGIEQIIGFYLDVAELLPGVGPAIAAARIAGAITEFLSSGDYEAMVSLVSGQLKTILQGLWEAIDDGLQPDNMLMLLLFGDPRLDYLLSHSTLGAASPKGTQPAPAPGSAGSGGKFGALKKTIDAFRRIGKALFRILRKLEKNVARPMQDVRAFSSSRPLLSFSLNFAADHIFEIVEWSKRFYKIVSALEDKQGDASALAALRAELGDQQKGFGPRVHGILKSVEDFKLPHTILDLKPVVAMVLTLAESYVLKRTGFAGKVISIAFQHSGAYDHINAYFAQAIVDAGADPNILWREEVLPRVEKRFNDLRESFVKRVNEVISQGDFKDVFEPVDALPEMKVATDPAQRFAETEETYVPPAEEADTSPARSPDRPLRIRPASIPAVSGGSALDPQARGHFERLLGQDLGHVRVHTGAVGAEMTDAFGADALTSGSHVFLRAARTPTDRPELMAHELAHVVQQSPSRPLGRSHSNASIGGHPERGLAFDPAREAEAEATAAAATGGRVAPVLPSSHVAGIQPSGVDWFTIARVMREVSNLHEVKKRAEAIEALSGGSPPNDVQKAVDKVLAVLSAPVANKALFKKLGPFEKALPMVESRMKDKVYATPIAAAAREIAAEALDPPVASAGERRHLAAGHFARQLEAYILVRAGFAFSITLNTTKVAAAGKEVTAVDLANPVKQVALVHIHLPYMDGRAPFWKAAIDKTWLDKSDDWKTSMRRALRPLLESKGIVPGIWPFFGAEFRFSLMFKDEAEQYMKQRAGAVPDPVPSVADYIMPKSDDLTRIVGVRLATYDHGSQKGAGRESHHLTQYLLADFFSNTNSSKPFLAARDYPGIKRDKDVVKWIAPSDAASKPADAIDVEATKGDGRGKNMPTISLAAVTHQKGKLHVTPEADDVGGKSKPAQGYALRNRFADKLPDAIAGANEAAYKKYVGEHGRDATAAAIFHAAQQTYASVEHHMSKQLEQNMPRLEYNYYMSLVEGTKQDIGDPANPSVMTAAQKKLEAGLQLVPPLAKQHNLDGMAVFGWNIHG